jgi:ATP-dependent Lhr-like helicase
MHRTDLGFDRSGVPDLLSRPVRQWFAADFPDGPTPAQELAWPLIAAGRNVLLLAPTGTGKTLAAFLAILDRLLRACELGELSAGLRCLYVSPLRSLNYDIERNLRRPLAEIQRGCGWRESRIRVGVRTGDTPARERRRLTESPPHILITTPESLSLLLAQEKWLAHWRGVEHIIVDEVHALMPSKRGADLAVSLERLAARALCDPCRVGLSATCGSRELVARFLVGPARSCHVVEAPAPLSKPAMRIDVESLLAPGEAPDRSLSYRRLMRRLRALIPQHNTTVIFANTRAFAEKLTHDLRRDLAAEKEPASVVAVHHSALDAARRGATERALKSGELRAVITSTSLELGVDIGSADLTVQIGLPGAVSRCVQRTGRSGHARTAAPHGLLLAATPAELAGAVVTAQAARTGRIEPLRFVRAPLDVVCQQLIGMACAGETSVQAAFELFEKAGPMAELTRADFDACLSFLAGELPSPAGALEPEPGARPRWTAPRLWRCDGWFGLRTRCVARWFAANVGTIQSEEAAQVLEGGVAVGTLEAAYAERLSPGDRFVLDGRALEVRKLEGPLVHARPASDEPSLPRWTSDRQSLSPELARELAGSRAEAGRLLVEDGTEALARWLSGTFHLDAEAARVLIELFEAQVRYSEIPDAQGLLIEEAPAPEGDGSLYVVHAPLHRAACEALARATAARLGRRLGRNVSLVVADLGWSIRVPDGAAFEPTPETIAALFDVDRFVDDVLEGLDRGELVARRFQHVAATGMMVLRHVGHRQRVRVGGLHWVSRRLYPLVKHLCPEHPLIRETHREVLEDLLDVRAAERWLAERPPVRFRALGHLSPFAAAWVEPDQGEVLQYESAADALRRLHERLVGSAQDGYNSSAPTLKQVVIGEPV